MTEQDARAYEKSGWHVVEDAGRGWRRVVASPQPIHIIEEEAIRRLVDSGTVVIAVGGGGIPVVLNQDGELRQIKGVYAVIDKDRASGLLAQRLGIKLFLVSTGVEKVSLNYRTPQQKDLDQVTTEELTQYLKEGHFAPGSMGPKVEAVLNFLSESGNTALITNPANIARALRHETGTWIEPG